MIYALLIKSNKYINIQFRTNACIFLLLKKSFEIEICRIFRKTFRKRKYICKKNNYNVHNFHDNFLHIKIQKIFEKIASSSSSPSNQQEIFFFLVLDHRTPHRAFKSLLKYMCLGQKETQYYHYNPSENSRVQYSKLKRSMTTAALRFINTKLE